MNERRFFIIFCTTWFILLMISGVLGLWYTDHYVCSLGVYPCDDEMVYAEVVFGNAFSFAMFFSFLILLFLMVMEFRRRFSS